MFQEFHKYYEVPITRGQDALSTEEQRQKATERLQELLNLVNQCMIRRTSSLLNKYLPVKFEMVICVRMSELQTQIYKNFIASDAIRKRKFI